MRHELTSTDTRQPARSWERPQNMGADFTSVVPAPGDRSAPSRRYWVVVLVVAVAALVVVVPLLPAAWQSVTHFNLICDIGDVGQADEHGTVRVQSCRRDALFFTWTCRGRFEVNDPMAEPYPGMDDVAVVNDAQPHPQGALVDAAKELTSHDGYLWGGAEQIRTVALWAWVLLCLVCVAGAVARFVKAGT
jgi:hypothetical protein